MLLHDHARVSYKRVSTLLGPAWTVLYDGKMTGHVMPANTSGWRYLLLGKDSDRDWVAGFPTRQDAADHLLSAYSPSARWLV